jgi:uncharacterized repeat protein (TIGR01451 family)
MRLRITSAFLRRRLAGITTIALLGAVVAGVGTSLTALAADSQIISSGPLTRILITNDLNCGVSHVGDTSPEFYGDTACGTFLTVGGILYGPAYVPAGGSASPRTAWTPVSQTSVTGSGTSSDPYKIVTVVAADATGVTLTETDSYVVGQESYRTDVQINNGSSGAVSGILYRAGDCFLQNSDAGYGRVGPGGAIACTASQAANSRIEQWFPLTQGSNYYESGYNSVWFRIGQKLPFPNTCDCNIFEDNGAGLSWSVSIAAGASLTFSHLTTFSPLGIVPLTTAKTADAPTAAAGSTDGYTITISNTNIIAETLDSIFDTLPAGFSYVAGSTTGATTSNPVVTGQTLTWSGPFTVPAGGSVTLHFSVVVSSIPGAYSDNAGATATGAVVIPTGPTATVTVTQTQTDQSITAAGVSISATEGQLFTGDVATFTDPDANATAAEYSATIDWGDGSATSAGTISGPTGGPFTVRGSHTYADEGTYTVTVHITDSDSTNAADATSTAHVADATLTPGPLSLTGGTEGSGATTASFTFTDANPVSTVADFTATISWGDATSSAGTVSGPTGGPYTVTGSHTYADEGSYPVTVMVTDDGGSTTSATGTAAVADAALTAVCAAPANFTQSFSGATATFTDANPLSTVADFTATTINWGDGTITAGTVSGPIGGPYTVSGSHTYLTTGPFTIKTSIIDDGGATATASCNVLTFAFAPGGGSFAIGDNNAVVGNSVTFWGAQWWKLNSLSGGPAPASFKGFAESPNAPSCVANANWSADTGSSTPPPPGPLPAYMGVIVTSKASQSGSTDSGTIVQIVVVHTNPGYQPDAGHAGTGKVVAIVC